MGFLIIIYLLYWIILSERFTLESIILGCVLSFIVYTFNKPLKTNVKLKNILNLKALKYWSLFLILLIKEIFKSNFHVAKIVLNPKLIISPNLTIIKTDIQSKFHRIILANSITLTPGTLTISLDDNDLLIHCLEEESALALSNSEFEKIIMKAEDIS